MKKRIVVTGGEGFIGQWLLDSLISQGHECWSIDLHERPRNSSYHYFKSDVSKSTFADLLVDINPDVIFHLAAQTSSIISEEKPTHDIETNMLGAVNICLALRQLENVTVIFTSSMAVYGSTFSEAGAGPETTPTSIYGITKLASEQILQRMRSYGHKINVVRLFNVYGPGQDLSNLKQGMVSIFCAMAIKDHRIVVKGSPDRTRDLIHVDDVVTKLVSCINSDYQSPVDVGTGSEISVAELVEMIKSKCDDLFGFSVTEYYEDGFSEDIFRSRSPSSVETSVLLSSGITNFLRWTHKELIKND